MKIIKREVEFLPHAQSVRYPWYILDDKEVLLELKCPGAWQSRRAVYQYARRRGWKVNTSQSPDKKTLFIRRAK